MKIIHLLNWKLETIEKELNNIKNQGFDAIQINPMQPFKEEKEFRWWSTYQPLGFKIGNMFGNKDDLKRLCLKAREYNLDIIVDVVLNHVANKSFEEFWLPHPSVDKILLEDEFFWKLSIPMKNGDDRWEATNYSMGLPGLDLSNEDLQQIVFLYLKELSDCGVKGLRFDAAKHIGLPKDGVDFFEKVKKFMIKNKMYGYGEFLGGDIAWRDEMSKYLMVLTPRHTAISNIKKQVSFFESHDTYLNINDQDTEQSHTRNLNDHDLIYLHKKLLVEYNHVLTYMRPIDENSVYCRNMDGLTCDDVYKLDEREYFNRVYLESEQIRDINMHVKKRILIK